MNIEELQKKIDECEAELEECEYGGYEYDSLDADLQELYGILYQAKQRLKDK